MPQDTTITGSYKIDPAAPLLVLDMVQYGFTEGSEVTFNLMGDSKMANDPENLPYYEDVNRTAVLFYNGAEVPWGQSITLDQGLTLEVRNYDGPNWPDPVWFADNSDPDGDYMVSFSGAASDLIKLTTDFNGDGKIGRNEHFEGTLEQLEAKLGQVMDLHHEVAAARAELLETMQGYGDAMTSRVGQFVLVQTANYGQLAVELLTAGLAKAIKHVAKDVADIAGFATEVANFYQATNSDGSVGDKLLATLSFALKQSKIFELPHQVPIVGVAIDIGLEGKGFVADMGDLRRLTEAADSRDDKYELQQERLMDAISDINGALSANPVPLTTGAEGWIV